MILVQGWVNPEVCKEFGIAASAHAAWEQNGGGKFSFKIDKKSGYDGSGKAGSLSSIDRPKLTLSVGHCGRPACSVVVKGLEHGTGALIHDAEEEPQHLFLSERAAGGGACAGGVD
jgi:hypothetical protein